MKKTWLTFAVVTTMLVVVTFFSIVNGSLEIGVAELIRGLLFGGNEDVEVIKDMRFPRIIVSLFAGANLAVSGLLLQAVMRNPLAEAGIIGISSGANFVALTMISFFPTLFFLDAAVCFSWRDTCLFSCLFLFMEIRTQPPSINFSWGGSQCGVYCII